MDSNVSTSLKNPIARKKFKFDAKALEIEVDKQTVQTWTARVIA